MKHPSAILILSAIRNSMVIILVASFVLFCSCKHKVSHELEPAAPTSRLSIECNIVDGNGWEADHTWNERDAIGVFSLDDDQYVNWRCMANSRGIFRGDLEDIITPGYSKSSFSAYYPYNPLVSSDNPQIHFDASSEESIDYLWAESTTIRDGSYIVFDMKHVMSKLSITVVDTKNSLGEQVVVTLSDVVTAGRFVPKTGTVYPSDFKTSVTGVGMLGYPVDFILPIISPLLPEVTDISVKIVYHGETFNSSLHTRLPQGERCIYTIDLTKADDKNIVPVINSSISGWSQTVDQPIVVE